MNKKRLLQSWFDDALEGDVVIDPRQINHEANGNLRYFDIPRGAAVPPLEAVEDFVARVVAARREQLRQRKSRSMTMYWWHDVLAGQLRCSLVCTSHRRLPFGVRVKRVESVRPIAEEWLTSPWLQGIPFDQLTCDPDVEEPEDSSSSDTVRVWSVVLRDGLGSAGSA